MTSARMAIQAPARNLVTSTITSTTAVNARPMALIIRERCMRRRAAGSLLGRPGAGSSAGSSRAG